MSTRAQIVIRDDFGDELWFYRHSDGYPEGVAPTLNQFCEWVNRGLIRTNAEQAAGWLILLGVKEYDTIYLDDGKRRKKRMSEFLTPSAQRSCMSWKVGAYEPCSPNIHGDIEHLYVITLKTNGVNEPQTASWKEVKFDVDANTYTGQKKK